MIRRPPRSTRTDTSFPTRRSSDLFLQHQRILRYRTVMSIGHWEPFWIGEPERQRYAALHRASSPDARVGVVMVPPLFYEQPRGRRFTTEAASALAGLGMPTLRFDFFGEGDRSEEQTSELQSLMRISYAGFCLK